MKAEPLRSNAERGAGFSENQIHDFMVHQKFIFLLVGYAENRSVPYVIYVIFIFAFYLFMILEASIAIALFSFKKELMVDAIHTLLLTVFGFGGLTIRFACSSHLQKARETALSGFYYYKDEELDEEGRRLTSSSMERIKKGSRRFILFMTLGASMNALVFSVVQWICVQDDDYEELVDLCNPYLPHCIYLPFSTRTRLGFITAYLINWAFVFYIYATAVAMVEIYISICLQLVVQTALLNHSIRSIPERAARLLTKSLGPSAVRLGEDLYERADYQACLYSCLRANLQHHQLLKRYEKEAHPYNGSCLLILMIVASFIFGSRLYLILKGPPISLIVNFIMTLVSEQGYPIFVCYYGQAVLEESTMLFESLYAIPWFNCNKSFNKALNVFMVYTRIPIRVKMVFFELTASIETYGDVWTAIYKVSNILKQSDSKLINK